MSSRVLPLAAAVLASIAGAAIAADEPPPPLMEVARQHGEKNVFRVYCKNDMGRYVATMKVDLKAGTINDSPYRVEGNALRWQGRNAPAPGQPAQERSMEIEGLRYTGPILGGATGSFACEPSKERPPGVIFSP